LTPRIRALLWNLPMPYDATQILPELRRMARKVGRSGQIEHDDLVQAACERLWRFDRPCDVRLAMTIAERAMIDEIRRVQGRSGTRRHADRHTASLDVASGEDRTRMDMLEAAGADPLAYLLAKEALAEHAAAEQARAAEPKINGQPKGDLVGQALSPRELAVMDCARQGASAAETAYRLSITEHTVKGHRARACAKLEALNVTHAVALLFERDLWPRAQAA
jgi:RNA polymerase sigma factor (sigma-70 family)